MSQTINVRTLQLFKKGTERIVIRDGHVSVKDMFGERKKVSLVQLSNMYEFLGDHTLFIGTEPVPPNVYMVRGNANYWNIEDGMFVGHETHSGDDVIGAPITISYNELLQWEPIHA